MKDINCLIVPTGIGASVGGFAGDANPVARLLSNVSDILITHPNVVNGAALTQIPERTIVVEGYLLDQFFLNKIALRPNVKHRIGVVVDSDIPEREKAITINCVNAARSFYGLDVLDIIWTNEAIEVSIQSNFEEVYDGSKINLDPCKIGNPETLLDGCRKAMANGATALAVMAKIPDPQDTVDSDNYINGDGYDPIGLIEAKISHLVAKEFMIPCAHAPILDPPITEMFNADDNEEYKVVDPRVSAEYLGLSFLPSVIQCLNRSAGIIPLSAELTISSQENTSIIKEQNCRLKADDITIDELANLVVPHDSCNGIPMLEAQKHGISLVTVKDNVTNLDDTAKSLGLDHFSAENYIEAAGYLAANKKSKSFVEPQVFLKKNLQLTRKNPAQMEA